MAKDREKQRQKKQRKGEKQRARKAEKEARREAEAQHAAAMAVAKAKQRRLLVAIPVLTAIAASTFAFAIDGSRLAGVSILVGGLVFLLVALGGLGSSVTPRDRLKSGSIDFGSGDRKDSGGKTQGRKR